MTFTGEDGTTQSWEVFNFKGDGVAMAMATDESIMALHAFFRWLTKIPAYMSTKIPF